MAMHVVTTSTLATRFSRHHLL